VTTSSKPSFHPTKTAPLRAVPLELGDALHRFFEVSNDRGVVLLHLDYTILGFNAAAEGILSRVSSRRWERGALLADYIAPEALTQYRTCFDQTIATGTPQRFERTYTTPRGLVWIEIYFEPFFDDNGSVELIGMFTRNMTAYRDAIATIQNNSDHYRNLLDYAPQAIVVADKEKILYANIAAAHFLGTTTSTLIGTEWQSTLRLQSNAPLTHLLLSDMEPLESAVTVEDQLQRFDGQTIDVIIHGFVTRYKERPAIQLVLINISEQKRSEAILRANAQYFRNMIEYSNDMISLMDASGTLHYVSPSIKRTMGYEEHEMLGRNAFELIHPDDVVTTRTLLVELLNQSNGVVNTTLRMRHRNGHWIWIEAIGKNALNDPDFRAIIINYRDIHERKSAEERLQQQLRAQTILREATTFMLSSLNPDELLNRFAEQMARVSDIAQVRISTVDPATPTITVRAEYLRTEDLPTTPVRLLGKTVNLKSYFPYGYAYLWNQPQHALVIQHDHPDLDATSAALFKTYGATTLLLIPLVMQGRMLAFAALWESRNRHYTQEEVELCEQIAQQAVIAIHNAELYSRAQQEIAERKRIENALRASEERYSLAVTGANDGIWDWDLRTDEMYFSPRWKAMLGYEEYEIRHEPNQWFARVHPRDVEPLRLTLNKHLHAETEHFEAEYRMWHRDGSVLWVLSRGLAIYNEYGQPYRIAGSQTDITTRKQTEERIHYEAFHDNLTDLPNRTYFVSRLGEVISLFRHESGNPCSVLFINLDRFKMINDSLGHHVGDHVLIQMGQRLEKALRTGDVVARMGGDEFAILLHDAEHNQDIEGFVTKLQHQLQAPFYIDGHEIFLSASIGIVRHDVRYIQAEEILRNADIAMHEAKTKGKARFQFFETSMHHRAVVRLQLENDLRRAIEHQDFELYYQPIISLKTGEISGLEALARWKHPTKGYISPDEFIPVAEESGLIVSLGRWILHKALAQLNQWRSSYSYYADLTVSVNLSVQQLVQSDIVADVIQAIENSRMAPSSLKLELTESIMLDQTADALHQLNYLRGYGVEMQLDDFGVGYSSLSRLHTLPISTIKIDRTFIKDLTDRTEPTAIVKTILTLARTLTKQVIAEGIETVQQLNLLRSLDTDAAQGYYFARPLPPAQITKLLNRRERFCQE
jgi:diguanylate cyclase (GGDEF)-like protein/PAS domain S-box-containing protein